MVMEANVPRPSPIRLDKLAIIRGSFILRIRRQHALDAHTDAFDGLDGRPARRAEEVETDDPIAVDVWMDGDGTGGIGKVGGRESHELDFGGFYSSSSRADGQYGVLDLVETGGHTG